ncbi:MAG: hypothetical protein U0271_11530 [Polyangiaceae bacterium]
MEKRLALWAIAVASLGFGTGCTANFMMVGSNQAEAPPASPEATYKVPKCVMVGTDQSTVAGPTGSYYLATEDGKLVLYEMDGGSGARIDNHWTDADGDHFFTYVRSRQGWHYVIPKDRTQPGKRYVLGLGLKYTYEQREDGALHPIGDPAAMCEMVPN